MTWTNKSPTKSNTVLWYRTVAGDPILVRVVNTNGKLWVDGVDTNWWRWLDDCHGFWHPVEKPAVPAPSEDSST